MELALKAEKMAVLMAVEKILADNSLVRAVDDVPVLCTESNCSAHLFSPHENDPCLHPFSFEPYYLVLLS